MWNQNRLKIDGHQWGIVQGADRRAPVGNRLGSRQRGTSREKNRVHLEGHQCGIEQAAVRGAPVRNRIGCRQRVHK